MYINKTVIEIERLPNGSQTITHAAEEDVMSNLKHFRGLHLPFAMYWLASHFQELFCLYQHNCNLHPLLCWPVNHCSQVLHVLQVIVHSLNALPRSLPAGTQLPGKAFLFSLAKTFLSGFRLSFRHLQPGIESSVQPSFLLAWQSVRYKQNTAFIMINPL